MQQLRIPSVPSMALQAMVALDKWAAIAVVFLLLLVPALMQAEVLLTEDFDYPIGDDLVSHGWLTTYGAATSGITVTNGLAYNNYAGSNVGGAAIIDCKTSSDQPHLSFGEQTEGKIYTAFLFQPTIVDKSGYFFCLRDNISMSTFNFCARVFISADYRLGLTFADNQRAQYAGPALDAQQVYLLVLEYAIVPGANNDSVSLYLDGTPILTGITDSSKPDIHPENIVLRGFDTNSWLVVDGIRVATTYAEAAQLTATSLISPSSPNYIGDPITNAHKCLRNGHLLIYCGTHTYTILGQTVH